MTPAGGPETAPEVTAIVLCGGRGRRFGGDKTQALLGDRTVLDQVVSGLPDAWPVVCAGPARPLSRDVVWCREDPVGGGPVAALLAALGLVRTELVVVLGGDMPFAPYAAPALVAALHAQPDLDGVVGRDVDGRLQPLLGAYRAAALLAAMPRPAAAAPLMRLLDGLRLDTVQVTSEAAADVDTPDDLRRARLRLEG